MTSYNSPTLWTSATYVSPSHAHYLSLSLSLSPRLTFTMHHSEGHVWELVLEPSTFPRASLVYGPQHIAFLFPLGADRHFDVVADVKPSQASTALPIIRTYGFFFAQLVADITTLAHGSLMAFTPPALVEGWERSNIHAVEPSHIHPLWQPLLGAAQFTNPRPGEYKVTFSDTDAAAWAGPIVVTLQKDEAIVGVPAAMPSGAAAWVQVFRLVVEMLLGTGEHLACTQEGAEEDHKILVHATEKPLAPASITAGDFAEGLYAGKTEPVGGPSGAAKDHHPFWARFKKKTRHHSS